MRPKYFKNPKAFRKWLNKHHTTKDEVYVGYYKKATGKPSMTWSESVDEALCYGWIDGIRHKVDDERYCIRFTPRRQGSIWSAVNIKRVKELQDMGLMQSPGIAAFATRDESKANKYSYEQKNTDLSTAFTRKIKANAEAWKYWKSLPRSAAKQSSWWVMSAKREETRNRRLNTLIESCEQNKRIPPLRWGQKK